MSMLNTLYKQESLRKITLIHAFKNRKLQAFADELSMLSRQMHDMTINFYNEEADVFEENYKIGRINEDVLKQLDQNGIFYVCGPVEFMQIVIQMLYKLGVPKDKVRYEFFGPSMKIETVTEKV